MKSVLGVIINSNLSFDNHTIDLYRHIGQKSYALFGVASYMTFDQKRILLKHLLPFNFNVLSTSVDNPKQMSK